MTTQQTTEQTIDIGQMIVTTPNIRSGRPRIAGTGVTVQRIVGWYKLGLTPEEITDCFGHIDLAQVHAALAYYHANSSARVSAMKRPRDNSGLAQLALVSSANGRAI